MTKQVGLDDAGKSSAQGFMDIFTALFQGSLGMVASANCFKVTQHAGSTNMSVDIDIGRGLIFNGTFFQPVWSTDNANVNVTVADASNPRKDVVVAYIDKTSINTSVSNGTGALKFKVIAGVASSSPVEQNSAYISGASGVGVGNPWIYLARIDIPAGHTPIVNTDITDYRKPLALMANLWGGSNNTKGHTIPNTVDDVVALLNAVQTVVGKTIGLSGNTATGNILSNPYKFRATLSSTLSTAASTWTKVPLNVESYDTSSNYDNVTNFRFTAPVAAFYDVVAHLQSNITGVSVRGIVALYKNGAEYAFGNDQQVASGSFLGLEYADSIQLAAGDYIELFVNTSVIQSFDNTNGRCRFSAKLASHN